MAPNAEGGVVTRPAPGEVLASVKPGERIVPAGGGSGGSTIRLELVGDLSRIIRAEAHNAIAEDRRRSKFQ
jgi:tRNA A58 N-methylase Trm61